eukprot:6095621-Pleurochrysis_carterae.AAC.4
MWLICMRVLCQGERLQAARGCWGRSCVAEAADSWLSARPGERALQLRLFSPTTNSDFSSVRALNRSRQEHNLD